jgi:hypothetical protein
MATDRSSWRGGGGVGKVLAYREAEPTLGLIVSSSILVAAGFFDGVARCVSASHLRHGAAAAPAAGCSMLRANAGAAAAAHGLPESRSIAGPRSLRCGV